jgi:hypothetical protein
VFDALFLPGYHTTSITRAATPPSVAPSASSSVQQSSSSSSNTTTPNVCDGWTTPVITVNNPLPPTVSSPTETQSLPSSSSSYSNGVTSDPHRMDISVSSPNHPSQSVAARATNGGYLSVLPSLPVRETQELISTVRLTPVVSSPLPTIPTTNVTPVAQQHATLSVPSTSSRMSLGNNNAMLSASVRASLQRPATAYALQLQQLRQSMQQTLALFEEVRMAQQTLAATRMDQSFAASTINGGPNATTMGNGMGNGIGNDDEIDQVAHMLEYGLTGLHSQLESVLPSAARASATTRTLTAAAAATSAASSSSAPLISPNGDDGTSSRYSLGSPGLLSTTGMSATNSSDLMMSMQMDRLSDQIVRLVKEKLDKGKL